MMNGRGKSDSSVLPKKPPNNAGQPAAEVVEGRGLAKGNTPERNALRTQSRAGALSTLERVRQVARKDTKQRFTALLHHVYDVARQRSAYFALKREAAPGVDGETWRHYGESLVILGEGVRVSSCWTAHDATFPFPFLLAGGAGIREAVSLEENGPKRPQGCM